MLELVTLWYLVRLQVKPAILILTRNFQVNLEYIFTPKAKKIEKLKK